MYYLQSSTIQNNNSSKLYYIGIYTIIPNLYKHVYIINVYKNYDYDD